MSTAKNVRWGKWVGVIASLLVLLKFVGFVLARLLGLARSEVQARGSDVTYVLGLAERRRVGRG